MTGDVFIVDDNPNNLSFLATLLREAGYAVRLTNSGRRALAAVRLHPPELILLDVSMPDLDGYQVCEELKRDAATRDIPVIFLSALDDVKDKVTGFRVGGADYVTKPFQADEVLARVASQLRAARLQQELVRKNQELARKNAELLAAWSAADGMFSTLSAVLPGTTLGDRYRLEAKIGAGGFAAVYRAVDLLGEKPVAVKVLRPYPGGEGERQRRQFELEVSSTRRLSHPNAVALFDSGITANGIPYLVMELLEGRSLAEELRREERLPLARAAAILAQICDALAAAHASGIIHRDIKPANVFLHRPAPGRELVKVVDFGIAKVGDPMELDHATTFGRLLGTPVYMSPERLLGRPYDGRADVYSVGMVLYETLAGRLPFDLPPEEGVGRVIMTCVAEPPLPLDKVNRDIPAAVARVVMSALAHAPAERPDAAGLAASFARALAAPPPPVETIDAPISTSRRTEK